MNNNSYGFQNLENGLVVNSKGEIFQLTQNKELKVEDVDVAQLSETEKRNLQLKEDKIKEYKAQIEELQADITVLENANLAREVATIENQIRALEGKIKNENVFIISSPLTNTESIDIEKEARRERLDNGIKSYGFAKMTPKLYEGFKYDEVGKKTLDKWAEVEKAAFSALNKSFLEGKLSEKAYKNSVSQLADMQKGVGKDGINLQQQAQTAINTKLNLQSQQNPHSSSVDRHLKNMNNATQKKSQTRLERIQSAKPSKGNSEQLTAQIEKHKQRLDGGPRVGSLLGLANVQDEVKPNVNANSVNAKLEQKRLSRAYRGPIDNWSDYQPKFTDKQVDKKSIPSEQLHAQHGRGHNQHGNNGRGKNR